MEDIELKEKFDNLYEYEIEPKLNNIASEQAIIKKKHDKFSLSGIIFAIIGILSLILSVILFHIDIEILYSITPNADVLFPYFQIGFFVLSFVMIPTAIVCFHKCRETENNFRKKLKQLLLKDLLSVFGDWTLEEFDLISLKEIQSTKCYPAARKKEDDDCISVLYNDIRIYINETTLSHVVSSGKSSHTVIDFDGIIIKTSMNKTFYGLTKGTPAVKSGLASPILNSLENILNKEINILPGTKQPQITPIQGLNSVLCEDFDIFSTDYNTASSLITPEFEEVIAKIKELFDTVSIKFAFSEGYLYLFLEEIEVKGHCKGENGFFEVGSIDESLFDKKIYKDLFEQLSAFNAVIEKLAAAALQLP